MMPVTSFVPTDLSSITLIGVAKSGSIVLLCKRYETKTRLVTGGSISFMAMPQPDFIQIPTQLLVDDKLQPSDRILFGYIYWMTKLALMKCVASNATLSELAGISERAVRSGLERLEQQGYVDRIYSDKVSHHRIEIVCNVSFSVSPGTNVPRARNKRAGGLGTNVPHNKIDKKKIDLSNKGIADLGNGESPELQPELTAFIEMRQAIHKPLTPHALKLVIAKVQGLYPGNTQKQRESLEQSVLNGWPGVYEVKGSDKPDPVAASSEARYLLHPEKYGRGL